MDRSRSKRSYHYDQDSDSPPRPKARRYLPPYHRRPAADRRSRFPDSPPPPPSGGAATTIFRVLCPESRFAAVLGKSGGFIKAVRQETGAWVDVHELSPGDSERIIEASDGRRREPDGAPPRFSPAEDAMARIHSRIVDAMLEEDGQDEGGGGGWGRDRGRLVSRLVVPRAHVGCLLGKGGKIIERMRIETRTHIRILPRDQHTPRCVSASEEVVQVVGDGNAVKKAVASILSRLKESLHRDRGPFHGRLHSPENYLPPDDDFPNDTQHRSSLEGSDLGSRSSVGVNRANNKVYGSQPSGYAFEPEANSIDDCSQSFSTEDLVFRILCPNEKVESVTRVSCGILELLQADVGVHVTVTDPVLGSDERIIVITSEEGPDDDLFPAQEALLHIQTHIVDLGPDKDNIITTRLLVKASEVGCLEGRDGSLSDMRKLTNANVQILPKEDHPLCATQADELVQIVGEIRAARKALMLVTEKLRSFLYRDTPVPKDLQSLSVTTPGHGGSLAGLEPASPIRSSSREGYQGNDLPASLYQNMQTAITAWQSKDSGGSAGASIEQEDSRTTDEGRKSGPKRFIGPLVTKSTLEVIIPEHAVASLIMRSSKLAQISEMSGATVTLIEDRPELTEKVVQISGSPEQAERAQSLLQGFILSTL